MSENRTRFRLDQRRAPIYEALEQFRQMRVVPFDVPGHKRGRGNPELTAFLGQQCVGVDVNSMKPLDNLCHPVSVIREAEELAADAFGAAHAFLMVGGTTSSVQAMILSVVKRGDEIILPRNVHRSVINALVLSGKQAVFSVTLNSIEEEVLPELTDAWVDENYGTSDDLHSVEALRAFCQQQLYTSNLNTAVMDDLLENSTFKSIPQQVMDYQVNQCLNYYSTLAGYYGYDLDGLVQNLLGYESTDDMLAHLESSLEDYSKEALLYQAVAESLDITPTQEQLDAYSDYKDTYGSNYCTMVALMDAVTDTLTSGAVVS